MTNKPKQTTHRPGPWAKEKIVRPGARIDADEWLITSTVDGETLAFGSVFDEPNACLVEAAPDLLEALQALMPLIRITDATESAWENAAAAIAKATGA